MHAGCDTLTEKEKEALRLLLRGHDAKSSARQLGLSVHTINERLRGARRKLDVTSSKEAARILRRVENAHYKPAVSKTLGDEPDAAFLHFDQTKRLPAWAVGVVLMLSVAVAFMLSSGVLSDDKQADVTTHIADLASDHADVELAAAVQADARAFLEKVDRKDWNASFAATSDAFREANTVARWQEASLQVYGPLGDIQERGEATIRYVNAPPNGYQEVVFTSHFANRRDVKEVLTMVREDGVWKVAGIMVD